MIAVWAFMKSGAGKIVALVLVVLAALGLARRSGKKAERAKRTEERFDALKRKKEIEKDVEAKSDDELISGSVRKRR